MNPALPTHFGRYAIVRPIGRGGMGSVFEAEHVHLRKRVALKTLHGDRALDAKAIERFLREGRAAASVRHPHVVDVTDVGVEDGTPYLVMELLEGEDLAAKLRRDAPLAVTDAVDTLLPVIAAVDAMYRAGIAHRDLKPENVFLAKGLAGSVPKVLDFGVCRPMDADARRLSSQGGLVGTPYYLSPEQVDGADGDAKSDQHALGVLLYECLAGERPYEAPTLLGLLAAIRDGAPADLRSKRGDLPPGLASVVARAMCVQPAGRFADARALGAALVPFASEQARALWGAVLTPSVAASEPAAPSATAPQSDHDRARSTAAQTARFGSPTSSARTHGARTHSARTERAGARRGLLAAIGLIAAATLGLTAKRALSTEASAPRTERRTERAQREAPTNAQGAQGARTERASAAENADAGATRRVQPTAARTVTARAEPRGVPRRTQPSASSSGEPARPVINGAPIVD